MSLDIGPAIRTAIIDNAPIVALLGAYRGGPSAFAFRPIPEDALDPVIIINPDAAITDQDGLTSDRPVIMRDIAIYGRLGTPGDAGDQSPTVEALGYMIRALFHRQKFSVQPEGYSVIDIIAQGPVPAPVDDDQTVGRVVSLTVRLRRNT